MASQSVPSIGVAGGYCLWSKRLVLGEKSERRLEIEEVVQSNMLFAGSLGGGQRSATVMSLIQSAKLNGLDL